MRFLQPHQQTALAGQQDLANNSTLACLAKQNYAQALSEANTQQATGLAVVFGFDGSVRIVGADPEPEPSTLPSIARPPQLHHVDRGEAPPRMTDVRSAQPENRAGILAPCEALHSENGHHTETSVNVRLNARLQ